ncbi:MAG: hypothetical protein V3U54_12955 [Thermodesulfobacteriota bacterium]
MVLTGETIDLTNFKEIIVADGIFDSFDSTAVTNVQFTDNPNNDSGLTISQASGLLTFSNTAGLNRSLKFQNDIAISPERIYPFTWYADILLETKVQISANTVLAGVALSHGDQTLNNIIDRFHVGIFRDPGANGVVLFKPNGETVKNTSVTVNASTFYILQVQVQFNTESVNLTKIQVDVWIDDGTGSVHAITTDLVERHHLHGGRLDGQVGVVVHGDSTATIDFEYFCSNRVEEILSLDYTNRMVGNIGQLNLQADGDNSKNSLGVSENSTVVVYGRNLLADTWLTRWRGFVQKITPVKGDIFGTVKIEGRAIHFLLDNLFFIGTFTQKTIDFIIADGTDGVFTLKAPNFDVTDVDTGTIKLTREYYQDELREILLRLAAEEDFIAWIDMDFAVHIKSSNNLLDSGISYEDGVDDLYSYEPSELSNVKYTRADVHGKDIRFELESSQQEQDPTGQVTKVIVDPRIVTLKDARRAAVKGLQFSLPIDIFKLEVELDYANEIGKVITLSIDDGRLVVDKKNYVIINIKEDPFTKLQFLTVAEDTSGLSDFLYGLFLSSRQTDKRDLDSNIPKTQVYNDETNIDIWIDFLVETSSNLGFENVQSAQADDGGFTDETTAATNDTVDDMTIIPGSPSVNDAYYYGHDKKFSRLILAISTTGSINWTLAWEYFNGTSFVAVFGLVDGTNKYLANPGIHEVTFTIPGDWATTSINSVTKFYIRSRVTAFVVKISNGFGKRAWVSDFAEHAKGRTVTANRTMAVLTDSMSPSKYDIDNSVGRFKSGTDSVIKIQVGDGTTPAQITDTALENQIGGNKTVPLSDVFHDKNPIGIGVPNDILDGFDWKGTIRAEWTSADFTGNVTECGYIVDRLSPDGTAVVDRDYATDSFWSPFNVVTQIMCHAIFPAFNMTSGDKIRVLFMAYARTSIQVRTRRL